MCGIIWPISYETGPAKGEGKRFWTSGRAAADGSSRNPSSSSRRLVKFMWFLNSMRPKNEPNQTFELVPLCSSPEAGSQPESLSIAKVPFDFVVGEMLLPAGAYGVEPTEIPGLLALRPVGGTCPAALVQAIGSNGASNLLFYRYSNLYFLAQVLAGLN